MLAGILGQLSFYQFLILQLTKRDIEGLYRGSLLGMGWAWLVPLMMLAVYTFVFSEIFRLKWPGTESLGSLGYAMHIFIGMLVFQFVADLLNRSPSLIQQNQNYVKKVVFPLPVLPLVATLSASFSLIVMSIVMLVFAMFLLGLSWQVFWLLLILPALFLFALGIGLFFSALGTYFPDLKQVNALAASLLMFLSPIFYPVAAVPESWQGFYLLNPLAQFMEAIRACVVHQQAVEPMLLVSIWSWGLASLVLGYWVFKGLKRGFADVL